MRKLAALIVGAFLLIAPSAAAALTVQEPLVFYVDLTPTSCGGSAASGTTTASSAPTSVTTNAARAGVSTLFIHGANYGTPDSASLFNLGTPANSGESTYILYTDASGVSKHMPTSANTVKATTSLGPYGMMQISGLTPCQATVARGAANYADIPVEIGLYGSNLSANDERYAESWAQAERVPIWRGTISGNTIQPIPFEIPSNLQNVRFYLRPIGNTPWGNFRAQVVLGLPRDQWTPPPAIMTGSTTFTLQSSCTGVSLIGTFVPDGTRVVNVWNSGTSGASLVATPNFSTTKDINAFAGIAIGDSSIFAGTLAYLQSYGLYANTQSATPTYAYAKLEFWTREWWRVR